MSKLHKLVSNIKVLEVTPKAKNLAQEYVDAGVIPWALSWPDYKKTIAKEMKEFLGPNWKEKVVTLR